MKQFVYLNDNGMDYDSAPRYFLEAANWAKDNCPTFQGCEVTDVSDVSAVYDQVAEYVFISEKDANWFKLKWM